MVTSMTTTQDTRSTTWVYDDGGRAEAIDRGRVRGSSLDVGDCVTRAIAIATATPYEDVYAALAAAEHAIGRPRSARNGISKKVTRSYIDSLRWEWTPTMAIGSGCTVHLRADELPGGIIICSLSRHLVAVVDGVVHDTHDPTRDGTRCVYGYWSKP
jgi:hypothetical protein